jgi:hypothetical protein
LLITSQKPNASYVRGFRAWNQLGRFVKKGEKGILIVAPIVRRKPENQDDREETSARVDTHGEQAGGESGTADYYV